MQLRSPPGGPAHPGADLRLRPTPEDLSEIHRVSGEGSSSCCLPFEILLAPGQDGQTVQKADMERPFQLASVFPSVPLSTVSLSPSPCQILAAPSGAEANSRWTDMGFPSKSPVLGRVSWAIC